MNRSIAAAAAVTSGLLVLSACGGGGSGKSGTGSGDGPLVLGFPAAVTSLDPAAMQEGQLILFEQAVYDSVLKVSPSGEIQPNLATSWEYDATRTHLTLTLRQGVKFTDGTPVDAAAITAGILHNKAGRSSSARQAQYISAVTAVDAQTVRIDLKAPDPSLLNSLATQAGFIASPAAIKSGKLTTTPVGSGPYQLDSARTVSGVKYVFTRNPGYWNKAAYKFAEVDIKVIANSSAMVNALKTGQIDGMYGSASQVADVKSGGVTVNSGSPASWEGFFLNDRAGRQVRQLADTRVRQAINYAIDRKGIAGKFYDGQATPTTQVFNPSSTAWLAALNDRYPYDPAKAKKLLAEAGATSFTLPIASFPGLFTDIQPIIQQQLAAVGITVKWTSASVDTYVTSMLGAPAFPIIMGTNLSAWTDIQNVAAPTAMMNGARYRTAELDALLAKAQKADGDAQKTALEAVNSYLVEQAWYLPIVAPNALYFSSSRVKVTMQAAQIVPSLDDFAPASK
jgi:peptide/nickel transport system substrate-binding protein